MCVCVFDIWRIEFCVFEYRGLKIKSIKFESNYSKMVGVYILYYFDKQFQRTYDKNKETFFLKN